LISGKHYNFTFLGSDDILVDSQFMPDVDFIVSYDLYPDKAYFGFDFNPKYEYGLIQMLVNSLGDETITIAFDE
jgi:hypothetical protein